MSTTPMTRGAPRKGVNHMSAIPDSTHLNSSRLILTARKHSSISQMKTSYNLIVQHPQIVVPFIWDENIYIYKIFLFLYFVNK
jgi:hypothetical protein